MRLHHRLLVAVLGTALTTLAADAAELSRFDFDGGLAADAGLGTLSYLNGTTTSDAVTFGTASAFSLPGLPDGDAAVMQFQAFAPEQALAFLPNVPANGGGSYINRYTIFWDTYFPTIDGFMGLVQTSPDNTNDADFFIRGDGAIGISGTYHGNLTQGEWHRIAMVWDGVNLRKYIDGAQVGTQDLLGDVDGRWAIYPNADNPTLFLTDEDNETLPGYISGLSFYDDALAASTIAQIGGPSAGGVDLTGITIELEPPASTGVERPEFTGTCTENPQPLQFNADGSFRIMQFADIQDDHRIEPRSVELMEAALDTYAPDLVVFSGDNITGGPTSNADVRLAIDHIVAPIENRGIPFFITFGNHDEDSCGGDVTLCEPEQLEYYRSFGCNINPADDPDLHGDADAVVLVFGPDQPVNRRDPKAAVWVLDSGRYAPNPDEVGGQRINGYSNSWDYIRQEQIAWYRNTSERFERVFGKKVPGWMFFHIPLFEFDMMWSDDFGLPGPAEDQDAIANPVRPPVSGGDPDPFNRHGIAGERNECVCTGPFNSGLFSAARERGDIVSMSVGHDHVNNYSGNQHGIQLSYAASAGFGTYGLSGAETHRMRGVRIFDLDLARIEDGERLPFDTYMVLAGTDLDICLEPNILDCQNGGSVLAGPAGFATAAVSTSASAAKASGDDLPTEKELRALEHVDCDGDGVLTEADRACLFEVKHGVNVSLTPRAREILSRQR
ncbi:MAG: hypothetical protein N838_23175 [Thiohalocapsa sp. PB-PSB1]|jgi:hypothetical protein|nr:MAG: hypothetical protein N838_14670 [Thiohalocapsa sp. PB-PSB1]QQO55815.1 MAG: hypothetical protein N838_23175 [Thiohalocapsa sp. PB-PSB1]